MAVGPNEVAGNNPHPDLRSIMTQFELYLSSTTGLPVAGV